MLAYVFWHWRKEDASRANYEATLRRFQDVLAANAPPGFLRSACFGVHGAPWANNSNDAYEDWYVVEGSAALDPLNDAAISGRRQAPHDEAAAGAAGGTAGLYRLRRGIMPASPTVEYWFSKPASLTYPALYELLAPHLAGESALWGRQMTLGPAREFCLQTTEPLQLLAELEAMTVSLRSVWPEAIS
jgi:hypothetical protein